VRRAPRRPCGAIAANVDLDAADSPKSPLTALGAAKCALGATPSSKSTFSAPATIRIVSVDPRAATGFGSRVEAYERGRPQYPPEAIELLAGEFGLTHDSTVLDLAAGTGKLTRQLIAVSGRVIAVEPSAAMRAQFSAQVPDVEVLDGTAEHIPLSDASVNAVFVGQAFHWFRPA
jgi:SAM-dependent methyltransferase